MVKIIILVVILATVNAGFLSTPASVSYYSSGLASSGAISYATPAVAASPAAITSTHSNILRTPGNLGQVSTYSKTIDTPYSSVTKSDVRVSNPGYAYTAAASPAITAYSTPAYSSSYYGSSSFSQGYGSAAVVTPAAVTYSSSLAAPAAVSYAAQAALSSPAAITSSHSNILRTPGNLGQVSTYSKTIDTPYSSVSKSDVRVSNPGVAYSAAVAPAVSAYAAPAYSSSYYGSAAVTPAVSAYAAPAYSSSYYGSAASSRRYGSAAIVAPATVSYTSSLAAPASVSYSSLAAPAAVSYAAQAALASPAAITSSHSNILRTPGNLGQLSTYSKTVNTPYSSVSKSDVRVSNSGVAYGAYGAPAYATSSYGFPSYARAYAAPATYATYAGGASHVSFSGPGVAYNW